MSAVAFMRELVAKGMSWEDAAEIAERFQTSVDEAVAAAMPKRSNAAGRQAAYRERKRNVEHNAEHNAVTHAVTDSVDNASDATLSLPLPPQTPPTPTHTRECVTTRSRKGADDFERFWAAYPLKKAKDAARKAFPGALGKASVETMIAAVERQRSWDQWQRGFIPHPATWLNAGRWADEEDPPITPLRPHDRPHHDHRQAAREDSLRNMHAGAMAAVNRRLG